MIFERKYETVKLCKPCKLLQVQNSDSEKGFAMQFGDPVYAYIIFE